MSPDQRHGEQLGSTGGHTFVQTNEQVNKSINAQWFQSLSIYIYVYTRICIYPSSPNALLEGVWTPKTKLTYSLRRCLEQDMHTDIENILPSGNLTVCY